MTITEEHFLQHVKATVTGLDLHNNGPSSFTVEFIDKSGPFTGMREIELPLKDHTRHPEIGSVIYLTIEAMIDQDGG